MEGVRHTTEPVAVMQGLDSALHSWSPNDVGKWVDSLLGTGAGQNFRLQQVDGPTLLCLTDQHLKDILDVTDPLARAKLLGHVRLLLPAPKQHLRAPAVSLLRSGSSANARSSQASGSQHGGYPGLSRSQSTATSIAAIFPTASRYTRLVGTGPATMGLESWIGCDSPSNSLRGSFSTAARKKTIEEVSPGPCAYNVLSAEKKFSATIGNSPRKPFLGGCQDNIVEPGPMTYKADVAAAFVLTTSPRAFFGHSPRDCLQSWSQERGPGPASYNTEVINRAPRATIGNSPRNTLEFVARRTAAPDGRSRPHGTPKAGANTSLRRSPSAEVLSQLMSSPRCTIPRAPRETTSYFMKEVSPRAPGAQSPPPKILGGSMGTATRWRSGSPGLSSHDRDKSPGPGSYRPRLTMTSTFR